MYLSLKNASLAWLLIALCCLSACGKEIYVPIGEGDDDGTGEIDNTVGSDSRPGGTTGVIGDSTVEINTSHYALVVEVGQMVPMAYLESDTGMYTIEGDLAF